MKKIVTLLTVVGLSIGVAQAKDRDYGVSVDTNNLQVGQNDIAVSITNKTRPVRNASVTLRVYQPDASVRVHKTKKVNKEHQYIFNVNVPKKGQYNYVVKFNQMGGVSHFRRGNFEL